VLARAARTWDLYQPWRMTAFAEARWLKADKAGVIAYWLLLPFAFAGGWLIRRHRVELLVLLAPVVVVLIATATGYGFPRFRHAADIVIVVLAAVAVGAFLLLGGSGEPEIGDCIGIGSDGQAETVDCDSSDAQFKVIGKQDGEQTYEEYLSDDSTCAGVEGTVQAVWFGAEGEKGTVYCAGPL
jgi:hypothetical protein